MSLFYHLNKSDIINIDSIREGAVMVDKESLRKEMMKKRNSLSKSEKKMKDGSIYNQVINDPDYKSADSVFLFMSFGSEINTKPIIQHALDHNKRVFLPKVVGKNLELFEIKNFENLERSKYGILEPNAYCQKIHNCGIDFILMPGLAFDPTGGRVGYGGGFYDRYISNIPNYQEIPKVAIAYSFQIIDKVPMDKYDIPVDRIIRNEVRNA
jgi:5-formyltetrahydrofolate cyclo-ligase